MTVKVEVAEPKVAENEGPVAATVVAELPATAPNGEKYELEFNVGFYNDGNTADAIDDFAVVAEFPTFAPDDFNRDGGRWVASKPFTVTLVDDAVVEPDETFRVGVDKVTAGSRPSHPYVAEALPVVRRGPGTFRTAAARRPFLVSGT